MKKRSLFSIIALAFVTALIALTIIGCTLREYTVTFVLGDGRGNVTATVTGGSDLYEPEPTDDGMIFAGWFLDEQLTKPFLSQNITSDMTLYARFIEKGEFVVTFVYENGTPDTTLVISGALTEPVAPTRAGYAFLGWKDASTGEDYAFGAEPTSAHTVIRAAWRSVPSGVTFTVYKNNGEASATNNVTYNAAPSKPVTPERSGYLFIGWFSDEDLTVPYDFSKPLVRDTAVYAGWMLDIEELGNTVGTEMLLATVKVINDTKLGSGVIYDLRGGYYYLLTNEHVVDGNFSIYNHGYTVTDAYGIQHNASLVAKDSSYDLAVLRFAKGSTELKVATVAEFNPAVGSLLISVGNPDGITNSVTYGECLRYQAVNVTGGEITFEVGLHDSPVRGGSSGGAVFNSRLEIAGINFAAGDDADGNFKYGAFIQATKIREFLNENDSAWAG